MGNTFGGESKVLPIQLYVGKKEGVFVLGKPTNYDAASGMTTLKDVVMINLIPTEKGMMPHPSYYPNAFMEGMVKKSALQDKTVDIDVNEFVVFGEDEITNDLIQVYRQELAKRVGIELATTMPPQKGFGLVRG